MRARLKELNAERDALTVCLERLASQTSSGASCKSAGASVTAASTAAEKITLFRRLFAGRSDVFPVRWENRNTGKSGYAPACTNEWVRGVCGKPQVKCGECPNQAFISLSDNVIASHLRGADPGRPSSADFVAGVYPVRVDETCWFLAVDFDGDDWSTDALAYIETCRLSSGPAALERSRSGKGGHVWIFFSQPIPARDARQLGATLLTQTLQRRPEVGFSSYDRMFPSQDTLPQVGFGNLIALPLQRRARDYPAIYSALGCDEARNSVIFDDVLTALEAGRCPLILTERRDHLETLRARFERFTRNLVVLHGGMAARELRAAQAGLQPGGSGERLVLATGRYLGEGFDDSRLDTLFLVMPISWTGTLAQYVGRLHRDHDGKREVIVYDYVDRAVPVLARMAAKREKGYKALGYVLES